ITNTQAATVGTVDGVTGISTPGNVTVTNTGNLDTSAAITTTSGNIALQATSGNLTTGAAVTAGGSGTVELTTVTSGNIVVNSAVSSTSGAITATSAGTIGGTGTFGTTGLLTTSSVGNTSLINANAV